jgi:hypothetical protein
LKHNPRLATQIISENLIEWGLSAAFEIEGEPLAIFDLAEDSFELTKHFQHYFLKELEAIP